MSAFAYVLEPAKGLFKKHGVCWAINTVTMLQIWSAIMPNVSFFSSVVSKGTR